MRDSKSPRKYVPVVGPRLKVLLALVFGLFALLSVNSAYLAGITLLEWLRGATYQNYFYLWMFLVHLVLGLALIVPVVVFGSVHIWNARNRPNRRAMAAGYGLFGVALALLVSGVVLMRVEVGSVTLVVKDPGVRSGFYWLHVIAPLVAAWLFVLHRLAGRRIKWRVGLGWAAVTAVFALGGVVLHAQDPRAWNRSGPASGEQYFAPSLARTSTGDFISSQSLLMNDYCLKCHADAHRTWASSAHAFSSFNNPAYAFSVRETRQVLHEREGTVHGARWCAGCHDPVPFLSGEFEDPRFDDPLYDVSTDPLGSASVNCTVCHAITNINSPRGNADFTIEEPIQYPFAYSANPFLQWVNQQLVKAKPAFHKRTFLKPLHQSPEFCGACHKVMIPPEINDYKLLRGQDHYDSFLLSGVSGHGASSWYYPPKAETNCNGCHMPLLASNDFGAKYFDDSGELKVHNHLFPSANTALPVLTDMPNREETIAAHRAFNEGVMRMDLFALREGGAIDGDLLGPIRPELPALQPGKRYLLEAVVRTVKMGHHFTQGTVDSNEIWVEATVRDGERVIGKIGGRDASGEVDPWAPFVNVYMLDRTGKRVDRRNVQDIFVPLYNRQIPPGAGDVTHMAFTVPEGATGPITIEASLQYRKFDTTYMRYVYGPEFLNTLPIMTLATDTVVLPVNHGEDGPASAAAEVPAQTSPIEPWQRWNDYGIGLFRKAGGGMSKGQFRQAEEAFRQVEALGRADGPLNVARVCLDEGRLDEAVAALQRAAAADPPAPPWSIAWFSGLVNRQNGELERAIGDFKALVASNFVGAAARGFDFSKDFRVLTELGQTLFERAREERGDTAAQTGLLQEAADWLERALVIDPEWAPAHWGLYQVYTRMGQKERAEKHLEIHEMLRVDDNARDIAVAAARRANPAADHAAADVVIYDLQRPGAPGLDGLSDPVRTAAGSSNPPSSEHAPSGPDKETP
ncbi:MAG: tetratricopeptide repeat protein [Phycisphaerales bacterium]|nr:tetratricopeptide repeat protein [Phycisphaerales bacterium]